MQLQDCKVLGMHTEKKTANKGLLRHFSAIASIWLPVAWPPGPCETRARGARGPSYGKRTPVACLSGGRLPVAHGCLHDDNRGQRPNGTRFVNFEPQCASMRAGFASDYYLRRAAESNIPSGIGVPRFPPRFLRARRPCYEMATVGFQLPLALKPTLTLSNACSTQVASRTKIRCPSARLAVA